MHMDSKDLELFVQKMMDKIVKFYYEKVKEDFGGEGYDTNEESFSLALARVTTTAFVSINFDSDRVFLYALDPMAFLPVNANGKSELWDYVSDWAKNDYKVQLAIAKFEMNEPHGNQIYHFTKDYLLETKRMVNDEAMTFHEAFLED